MIFQTFRPKNPLLRPYISYYYQQAYEQNHSFLRYQCFPHLNLSISFFERATFLYEEGISQVSYTDKNAPLCLLTVIRSQPLWVEHYGPLRKVAVAFEPLGLSAFTKQPLSRLTQEGVTALNPFGIGFQDFIAQVFTYKDHTALVECLDSFFAALLQPAIHPQLDSMLTQTIELTNPLPLSQIADQHHISRRHFNRLFWKHLCCSPETYRQIARFRQTLQLAQASPACSLTQIAYLKGYADQAHWTKQCSKWTGYSPTRLLRLGTSLGDQDIFWRLSHQETNTL
jgi:AraC-like DNA-binding protein